MYESLGISKELEDLSRSTQEELSDEFKKIDKICE